MAIGSHTFDAVEPSFGRRCVSAAIVLISDVAAVLLFLRFDILGIYEDRIGFSCGALGIPQRLCLALKADMLPRPIVLTAVLLAVIVALGLYDPRPLFNIQGQSRRSSRWLGLNAAGAALFISPYMLAAAGVPYSYFTPFSLYLVLLGAGAMACGFLLWFADFRTLVHSVKPHQLAVFIALVLLTEAATRLSSLAWANTALVGATFETTALFLRLLGRSVLVQPEEAKIAVDGFSVVVAAGCSGVAGVTMVSAVVGGYVFLLRRRLVLGRALLLLPLAAALSWILNAARIAALILIGAYVSPDLAVEGFHEHAGWLSFCFLSVTMLVAAENISWIHRNAVRSKAPATPFFEDPVAAQIIPFVVLLVSALAASSALVHPESGYPLRALCMVLALLLFRHAYRLEIYPPGALPILGGVLVAIVWLGVKAGGTPVTVTGILGPVSHEAAFFWSAVRIAGTVLLIPLVEEMFFRGFLLRQLDFGGLAGKLTALALSSALFGALHQDMILAGLSGVLFGLIAMRKGRLSDAVAAHAIANAGIAAWALWGGDWSVI